MIDQEWIRRALLRGGVSIVPVSSKDLHALQLHSSPQCSHYNSRLVYQTEEGSPYQLSGVGRYPTFAVWNLLVPTDPDSTLVDFSRTTPPPFDTILITKLDFFTDFNHDEPYPRGYIIHMWCWCLIKRIIENTMEGNLDSLVNALRQRWSDPRKYFLFDLQGYQICVGLTALFWLEPEPLDHPIKRRQLEYQDLHPFDEAEKNSEAPRDVISLRDPRRSTEIKKLIRDCIWNRAREETKKKARRWCTKPPPTDCWESLNLPLDIKFLILDYLDYQDIPSVPSALGWQISDVYWRSRYPRDLIYELEEMRAPSVDIDWKTLYLGTERLLDTLPELRNRQRIFRILRGTKRYFNENIKAD